MRRHAKASSAGSTSDSGIDRIRFGLVFRSASRGSKGVGAPSYGSIVAIVLAAVLLLAPAAQAGKVPGFGLVGAAAGSGELTSGSNVIANVTTTSGALEVGQNIRSLSPFFSAIPSNARITAVGAGTVTMSVNATETGARSFKASFMQNTKGVAVNTSSSGPTAGHVYSSDSDFRRIAEFTPSGSLVRLFGMDVVASGPDNANEVQRVAVNAGAGKFTLTFNGKTTGELEYNAPASGGVGPTASVQNALNELESINTGGGSVSVSGGPGSAGAANPYVVTFNGGPLKGIDVAQMTATNVSLTGGSPSTSVGVTTSNAGNTGFEICEPVANPSDVCKSGSSSSAAGGLVDAKGLAIDPVTGNVFVADQSTERINVYSGTGQFQGAFGWSVNASSPESKLQFCTFATRCQAGSSGAGVGQFASMEAGTGDAAAPAISPLNGDLLFPSAGNRRVDEFALTLNGAKEVTTASYVKGFGQDVIPTINETQTVTSSGVTGGTFSLSFNSKSTDATGTGDLTAGSKEVTNFSSPGVKFIAGEEIVGTGIPAGTRITAVTFDSLTLSAAATQSTAGVSLSAALPFNASAATIQTALQSLSTVGANNLAVSGSAGAWTVEFKGPFAGVDVPSLAGNSSKLTGPSPTLTILTTQVGANGANAGYEICTVATACQRGSEGESSGLGGVFNSLSVAVDSTGSIYVTSQPNTVCRSGCVVQKFNPSATSVEVFAPSQLTGPASASPQGVVARRVTVDPANDHVLVAKKADTLTAKLYEFTKSGALIDVSPPAGELQSNEGATNGPEGLAFGAGGRLYYGARQQVSIFNDPPAPKATIDPVGGIGQTTATFSGVAQPSAPGIEGGFPTVAYFEYSGDGITWTATEPVSIGTGTGAGSPNSCPTGNPPSCIVSTQVTGLQPGRAYLVRMVASNGTAATSAPRSFETGAGAPTVTGTAGNPVGQTTATINGLVNPNNRSTTYHFEWGEGTEYGTRIPLDFDVVAGSGGQPVPASASLTGLQPGTTYHFRIVATSSGGTTVGPDGEFTTLNSHELPANRNIELVSPADKRPAGGVTRLFPNQLQFQAAEDGESVLFQLLNGVEDSTASGQVIYRASRSIFGWSSDQVTPPSLLPPPEGESLTEITRSGAIRYGNPDNLNCALVESHNPLSDDTPEVDVANQVTNLYRWTPSDGQYTLITNRVPTNPNSPAPLSGYYRVFGASKDCSRIYFLSQSFNYIPGSSGLYEWDNGVLRDAGLLPNGAVPAVGVSELPAPNAVSTSGRFFFDARSNQGLDSGKQAVFVRKGPGAGETVDASQSATAVPPKGAGNELAAADGSSVYFLANYGIAATTSNGPTTYEGCASLGSELPSPPPQCDLYRYVVESGQLTDISADSNPVDAGQGATVAGIMDVSDDGSTAYFAAFGQLVPGKGRTFAQNKVGGFANVYRWHEGQLSFVGTVTRANLTGSGNFLGGALARNQQYWTSQTTSDGDWFLYASDEVTDVNPNGTREAYLFSDGSNETVCVSCTADGAVPMQSEGAFGETLIGSFASNPGYATIYQPRSLTEDGRVFFTSRDKLTPNAVLGNTNIYEWHRGQTALLISSPMRPKPVSSGGPDTDPVLTHFIDSGGPDGRDVFITSFEHLNGADFDFASDLYDFRVGGVFTEAVTQPTPCDPASGACQGAPSSPPSAPAPASSSFSGPSNPPAPTAKKPKGKKKHHKKRRHRKRVSKHSEKQKRIVKSDRGGAK